MNMKNKMLIFDLDGTCLTNDYRITDNFRALIQELSKDNYVLIATGRSLSDAYRYYRQLDIDTEIICYNGAFIYSPKNMQVVNNVYMKNHMDILQYLKEHMVKIYIDNIVISQGMKSYRLGDANPFLCDMMYDEELPNTILDIDTMLSSLKGVHRIVVSVQPTIRMQLMQQIKEQFPQVNVVSWRGREDIIDINICGIDKWDAIVHLATQKNIETGNIITFGDSDNDVQMIKKADIGVCMLNGSSTAKIAAKQITQFDNNNDGVFRHLLQMMRINL